MIRLEIIIELKFLNSGFSSLPLVEIRQTAPRRAIRGNSISVNSTLPPLKNLGFERFDSSGLFTWGLGVFPLDEKVVLEALIISEPDALYTFDVYVDM